MGLVVIVRMVRAVRRKPATIGYLILASFAVAGVWRVESIADDAHETAEKVEAETEAREWRTCMQDNARRRELRQTFMEDVPAALAAAGADAEAIDEFRRALAASLEAGLPIEEC